MKTLTQKLPRCVLQIFSAVLCLIGCRHSSPKATPDADLRTFQSHDRTMNASQAARMNCWTSAALLLVCLSLATGIAIAVEPPTTENKDEIIKNAKAEMRAARERLIAIQSQLEANTNEISSPQRKRTLEEIRKKHESLAAEMNREHKRFKAAQEQLHNAVSSERREHDERASGLHNAPPEERIRTGFHGWSDQGHAAANAFGAKNPTVKFFHHDAGVNIRTFRLGEIDLMGLTYDYQYYVCGREKEEFEEAFPKLPKAVTVGYWPFVVAVHPSNPIKSLTLAQLRTFALDRKTTWKNLRRPKDGLIRLYTFDTFGIAKALTGRKDDNALSQHQVFNAEWGYMEKRLKAVADDPDALLIWHHTTRIANSGLKILPIVHAQGESLLPTNLPAVASGRYVLRTPLAIMLHPAASGAAKRFAEWLVTVEAADAIQNGRDASQQSDVPYLAHVTLAEQDHPSPRNAKNKKPRPEADAPDDDKPLAKSSPNKNKPAVNGAIAVMPTEPLSMYFLMATPAHHAAYEQTISDAIAADRRLKILDRTQLTRALEERKQRLLEPQAASPQPITAADVFVFSYVVTEAGQAYLHVEAVHSPTASRLGGIKLPIDPANPSRFNPPLERVVATWWPEVVKRLIDVRTKPIWTVVDVYAGKVELDKAADTIRGELEDILSHDSRVFLASAIPTGQTQQEVLLQLMGLSRSKDGRFNPEADYLLEAQLTAPDRINLRLRGPNLAVLAQTEIIESDRLKMLAGMKKWLADQSAQHSAKATEHVQPTPLPENDWALAQARLEYEMGHQLGEKANQRQKDYHQEIDRLGKQGITSIHVEENETLVKANQDSERYTEAARRHYRRAAQLNPAWEDAAYLALNHGPSDWIFAGGGPRDISFAEPIDEYERFLQRFPQSAHAQQVLADFIRTCIMLADRGNIPPGLDERSTRIKYFQKGFDGCRRYIAQYTLQGKTSADWSNFVPKFYLHWLKKYFELANPANDECRAIANYWSENYDTHLDKAPHSDFVRLLVLAQRKNRPAFVALLTKVQQRWPDPKHQQWQDTAELVGQSLHSLFYDRGGGDSFNLWLAGKRGIGDLPRPGYDPKNEREPRRNIEMILCCRNCDRPMQPLIEAYNKRKTGLTLLPEASPYNDFSFDEFVHGRRQMFAYGGELNETEKQRLKMMHKGPPTKVILGYGTPPDPNHQTPPNVGKSANRRQPLVFLAQPEPSEAIQDLLDWLVTPEARKILAQNGITRKP